MAALENLGMRIADLRKRRGLTQEDLAGLAEMDRSYLSEIENGHKNLSVASLIRIAAALNERPGKLLDEATTKSIR